MLNAMLLILFVITYAVFGAYLEASGLIVKPSYFAFYGFVAGIIIMILTNKEN